MIPELLAIIEKQKRVSLSELSALSGQKEEVVEQIMEQLSRKNKIRKSNIECHGCLKDCSICINRSDLIIYESIR